MKIPHIEFRTDVFFRVQFAAGTQGVAALFNDLGGKRDITCDDQVTGIEPFDDLVVRDIEPTAALATN